jgi:hypothetical protein
MTYDRATITEPIKLIDAEVNATLSAGVNSYLTIYFIWRLLIIKVYFYFYDYDSIYFYSIFFYFFL